jgi:hypothetical protein
VGLRPVESVRMSDDSEKATPAKKPAAKKPVVKQTPVVMEEPIVSETTVRSPVADQQVADPVQNRVAVPAARRSGWAGPVMGGVIAAVIGFGLAQFSPLNGIFGGQAAGPSLEDLAALKAEVTDLRVELDAVPVSNTSDLTARLAALESELGNAAPPDLSAIEGRIAALEARPLGSLSGADAATLATIQDEIAAIRAGGIAQAQIDAASAALQTKLDEAMAAATALQDNAAEAAAKSAQRGALLQIGAALDSGAPFGASLIALEGVELPEALTTHAQGLPSLKSLQDSFPQAARLALDAALKADMGDSWTDRATSFLRTQVGARSLSPREGDDPDAILSRAESALTAGDVPQALAELDGLPDVAKTAMANWRYGADQREAAQTALSSVMQELGL